MHKCLQGKRDSRVMLSPASARKPRRSLTAVALAKAVAAGRIRLRPDYVETTAGRAGRAGPILRAGQASAGFAMMLLLKPRPSGAGYFT